MATNFDSRLERLEQLQPAKEVVWLRKIVREGEKEESDQDCILRYGMDPNAKGVEYAFVVRAIVSARKGLHPMALP